MKKYYVIILCLIFIAGITSCATKQEDKPASRSDFAVHSITVMQSD